MKYFFVFVLFLSLAAFGTAASELCPSGETCICTTEFWPVCSTNNCEYTNICGLNCAGETLAYVGKCGSNM